MLALEFIHRIIESGQQAIEQLNKDDRNITVLDIQRALGKLDEVQHELEAAQWLLREELKMTRGDYNEEA